MIRKPYVNPKMKRTIDNGIKEKNSPLSFLLRAGFKKE
jgi:hypothetical protein